MINKNLKSGEVELVAHDLTILNTSDNPPIEMIPVDLAAQALIALDLRVVETFPKKWVLQTLWKMTKRDIKKWLKKAAKK